MAKSAIFWWFARWYPLGDLCKGIPSNTRGFRLTNPGLQIPGFKSSASYSRMTLLFFIKNMDINTKFQLSTISDCFWFNHQKIYTKFGFNFVEFAPYPLAQRGFQNPYGYSSRPSDRSRALGYFQISSEVRWSGAKSPIQNHIFVFKF